MLGNTNYEAIVIGGSYAGLSAAMSLGRLMRRTLVIDSGKPCNASTPHSHNFLTQDGKTPGEISQIGRAQVEKYDTVTFREDFVVSADKTENGFEVKTLSGTVFNGKKLIFATGVRDVMPDIEGFADCWGISVIHCPYCHGYEYRSKKTAVFANGPTAVHLAALLESLTREVIVLTNGTPEFSAEEKETLEKLSVDIIASGIDYIKHENGHLDRIVFKDNTELICEVMYARIPFIQHSEIPKLLGCTLTEQGHIETDKLQKTTVPDIFACGDATSPMRSVANAVAAGNLTGAMVNKELAEAEM